jgi:hypothetical protein
MPNRIKLALLARHSREEHPLHHGCVCVSGQLWSLSSGRAEDEK